MIAAKQKTPKPENDSYRDLAEYIADAEHSGEKVLARWFVGNTDEEDFSSGIAEVEDTQDLNTRTERAKTYHLVVSFHPEDEAKLTPDIFKEIEREFAQSLGYEDHQRHCGIHKNTANLHMHIAYNMIHPEKLTRKAPYRDYKKLSEACRELEKRYGFSVVEGRQKDPKEKAQGFSQGAAAMEAHTWQQSFQSYAMRHKPVIMDAVEMVKDWQTLHTALARYGMEIKPHGNGLVVKNKHGKHAVKASAIDRNLSLKKLEARFGSFALPQAENVEELSRYSARPLHKKPERGGLYEEWLEVRERRADIKAAMGMCKKWEEALGVPIREKWAAKRTELGQKNLPPRNRYALLRASRRLEAEELEQAKKDILSEQADLRSLMEQKPATWVDFLRGKAVHGDETALAVLRSDKIPVAAEPKETVDFENVREVRDKWRRKRAEISESKEFGRQGRGLAIIAKAHELAELEKLDPDAPVLFSGFTSDIDARGTVLFKLSGGGMIRDTGKEIRFSAHDKTAKAAALLLARAKWGKHVRLEGNEIQRHEQEPEQAMTRHNAERTQKQTQHSGMSR